MICNFCPLLGFRTIQAVNEAVQEIQVQVDSNQVASWLQGLVVTCRDGLEPLHSYWWDYREVSKSEYRVW